MTMKLINIHRISIIIFALLLVSCSTSSFLDGQKQRVKNGNNLSFIYFKTVPFSEYEFKESLVVSDTVNTVIQFFGTQTEITNEQYWAFLNSIKKTSYEEYEKHLPRHEEWLNYRDKYHDFADSLKELYENNEASKDYPIVNITPENMFAYVNWLNDIEPNKNVKYRLFSSIEWLEFFNCTSELNDSTFTWEGNYWRNERGSLLANFAELNQDQYRYNRINDVGYFNNKDSLGIEFFILGPKPVFSYNPNCYGAYNMAGNVAEFNIGSRHRRAYYKTDKKWRANTFGGSWGSPIFYLRKSIEETYLLPSPLVGFRVLMVYIKEEE
jgi:formylglycine-generating enzyme required for sulfatase activity